MLRNLPLLKSATAKNDVSQIYCLGYVMGVLREFGSGAVEALPVAISVG